jgi:hypothetical protein
VGWGGVGGTRRPLLLQLRIICHRNWQGPGRVCLSSFAGCSPSLPDCTTLAISLPHLLLPQIGLPGYSSMPAALAAMPRQERATYCNDHWQQEWKKVFTLEFSRWGQSGCERQRRAVWL